MAKRRFGDKNIVHGDEKWFYLMHDGSVCRVFPQSIRNGDGELQRVVTMHASPKIYHKSRMPKVMFLAVTARPRPEHGFDGKLGLWPFTVARIAKRSDSCTGTVAGETAILEPVTVNAEVYRNVMLRKGGVFDVMRGGTGKTQGSLRLARYYGISMTARGRTQPRRMIVSGLLTGRRRILIFE